MSNARRHPEPGDSVPPDALIDAFFDGDLDRECSAEFFRMIRADRDALDEFAATRRIVEELKATPPSPDFSAAILREVHRRRPWASERVRRLVKIGRIGAAAACLTLLAGVLAQRRAQPEAQVWRQGPQPVTTVVRTSGESAVQGAQAARASLQEAGFRMPLAPLATPQEAQGEGVPALAPRAPVRSGDASDAEQTRRFFIQVQPATPPSVNLVSLQPG